MALLPTLLGGGTDSGGGAAATAMSGVGSTGHVFTAPTYPPAYVISAGSGNTDLYTVPAGRKAYVFDFMITNSTAGAIAYFPQIKIGGSYFAIGSGVSEGAAGIGHNYAMLNATRLSGGIVLNAGESFAVNTDVLGGSFFCDIVEFADSDPVYRADIQAWSAGNNTLFTVPVGKTVRFGSITTSQAQNNPALSASSIHYRNASGSSRTLSAGHIVPNGGSPSTANQIIGSNVVLTASGFAKLIYGNLEPGASVVLVVDAGTATQYAWVNYVLK